MHLVIALFTEAYEADSVLGTIITVFSTGLVMKMDDEYKTEIEPHCGCFLIPYLEFRSEFWLDLR